MNLNLNYDLIKTVSEAKEFPFFEGKLDVNIYGVRSNSLQVDEWNDILGICYLDDFGQKVNIMHRGTTKPGLYYLKKKLGNVNGTFIMKPGFFRACWKMGEYKNYLVLRQAVDSVFRGWRDNDADGQFDYSGKVYTDATGVHMHAESLIKKTEKVGPYSAGCQVREYDRDHFMVIYLIQRSMALHGPRVSYKLFNERDFMN